jgi:thiol:disulfide interchange protein DsbD
VVLAALLFFLGLSLAGVFEIGLSWMGLGSSAAARPSYTGAFFTGVLATVVATPCTAPFMGSAVGFALSQSAGVAFATFTALAVGLALPYVAFSCFPQAVAMLPKPGRWMEGFKQALAFPLFAAVIWLVWVYGQQAGINAAARLLAGLLGIAVGAWLLGRFRSARLALPLALAVFALSLWFPLSAARVAAPATSNSEGLHWEPFSAGRVQEYQSEGKPVFVDFTAAWCLTCQVNERTVFASPEVRRRVSDSGVALLKADWTSYDPVITQTLTSFGRSGVPFYLLYGKDRNTQPAVLPELLTPKRFLAALHSVE